MLTLCISYRRADSAASAGRIFDRLTAHFGKDTVFIDTEGIPVGVNFRSHIQAIFKNADVLLALIGPNWIGVKRESGSRINEPNDPIRMELETALAARIPIIPVLIDQATMPDEKDLPEQLKEFSSLNAAEVTSGRDFNVHMERLVEAIERITGRTSQQDVDAGGPGAAAMPPTTSPRSERHAFDLAAYLAVPSILLAIAHYVLVMKLDLSIVYFRFLGIAMVLFVGYQIYARRHYGFVYALSLGAMVGVVSAAAILVIVGLVDRVSIVPSTTLEWQETAEHVVAAAFAAAAGHLLAHVARSTAAQKWRRLFGPR